MIIKPKMQKALNKQLNVELSACYSYLSMAGYFEFNDMPGFAQWFKVQSHEEFNHAMRLNAYIISRGGQPVYMTIEAPENQWKSCLSIFEEAYAQELKVSALIDELMDFAKSEHDYATEIMLQWFVTEQVEEEDSAKRNVEKFKFIKNAAAGVLEFDHQLGERIINDAKR